MTKGYPVYIIQGAQWGSEGKGQITAIYARLCLAAVRTGSINAGHTVYFKGRGYKMQLLPAAWPVLADNEDFRLVLGPGCYIQRDILAAEVAAVEEALGIDLLKHLLIDYRCTLHTWAHETSAALSNRHHEIGATGKGSTDAVMDRMTARGDVKRAERLLFASDPKAGPYDFRPCLSDTSYYLHDVVTKRGPILLEGTQGAHLDFLTGPYPFTTNRCVSTAAWLAYAGLPPTLDVRPILVARTYPIRVAGNSGPMPNEITWPKLYRIIKAKMHDQRWPESLPRVDLKLLNLYEANLRSLVVRTRGPVHDLDLWTSEERYVHRSLLSEAPTQAFRQLEPAQQEELARFFEMTTVTRKIRRVSLMEMDMVEEAIRWNGCHEMWITFLNYEFPVLWGETDPERIGQVAGPFSDNLARRWKVPIAGVSTEREAGHHVYLG